MSSSLKQFAGALLTIGLLCDWVLFETLRITVFNSSDAVYLNCGLSRHGIGSMGLWQLVSYAFFHSGWVHVAMNAILLLSVGVRLEWMLGRIGYGMVLLGGVLLGGVLHLMCSPNILVGGSGAVFAVLLCMMTLSPESKWLVPFPVSAKNLGRGIITASLLLLLINPELGLPGLSSLGGYLADAGFGGLFRISHACHLGGALAGWLCALWVLRNRVTLEDLQRDRARREAGPDEENS